jgi:hypothetical protein
MELYVPRDMLKELKDVFSAEGVSCKVTNDTYSLQVEGKEIAEVVAVEAQLLETDVPVILEQGPEITLRAFRLPSGERVLLTDVNGNFIRVVTPPAGWER